MKAGVKKGLIAGGIILVVLMALYSFFVGNYNNFVKLDEDINAQWSQIQNQYQRRYDLIPNLVSTVQGYAKHESSVFTDVTQARAKAGGVVNIDQSVLDNPEELEKFQKIQNDLSSSLQRLLAVTENYPELKANENFLSLQSQLEGTENRISVERKRYNELVGQYNREIRTFPKKFIADLNGFTSKSYFTASEESQSAPKVQF